MPSIDKLSVISGALFLAADLFAIASLCMPNWIVSDIGGETSIGLLKTCLTIYGRSAKCFTPDQIRSEWVLTFICVVFGIICVTITVILLAASYFKYNLIKYARWIGFVGIIMFCNAAVIFPIGFNMDQIGGEPYQLPSSFQVGISYIFFVLGLWFTVIAELFAGKVCLPRF
ncbi:unnamed protein product [Owenia fusiformis]|uniref:Uncharacterized protein n=1 Tax=Owenia fusiformis TaxID=6347 RepID=A0A8J1XR20_OWEFU|nr:unnamed protein product [Owenia fusiformis]